MVHLHFHSRILDKRTRLMNKEDHEALMKLQAEAVAKRMAKAILDNMLQTPSKGLSAVIPPAPSSKAP